MGVQTDRHLLVTFCHGDEDSQEEIATTGQHALEIARRLLAQCDKLYDGDLLSISHGRPHSPSWKRKLKAAMKRVRQSDG